MNKNEVIEKIRSEWGGDSNPTPPAGFYSTALNTIEGIQMQIDSHLNEGHTVGLIFWMRPDEVCDKIAVEIV